MTFTSPTPQWPLWMMNFAGNLSVTANFLANPDTVGANYSGQPAVVLAAHLCQAATNSDFSRRDSSG